MAVWYIEKTQEKNKLIEKIKQILNIIEIQNKDGKMFCTLPINENTKNKKIKTIVKKLNIELYRNCIENVVLSNHFKDLECLKNELYKENVNILNGRILFQYLVMDIIEYIYNNQNKKLEEGQITVLCNDNIELNLDTIIEVAKKVKRVNIVTNNINKFKILEEHLYNEFRNND